MSKSEISLGAAACAFLYIQALALTWLPGQCEELKDAHVADLGMVVEQDVYFPTKSSPGVFIAHFHTLHCFSGEMNFSILRRGAEAQTPGVTYAQFDVEISSHVGSGFPGRFYQVEVEWNVDRQEYDLTLLSSAPFCPL